MVARVMATWRPVAWSACSAMTVAIASSVGAVIDTRSAAHSAPSARECAQVLNEDSQPSRLVHTGVLALVAPARTIQLRRPSHAAARWTWALSDEAAGFAESVSRPRRCEARPPRRPMVTPRFTHRSRAVSGTAPRYALP